MNILQEFVLPIHSKELIMELHTYHVITILYACL